MQPIEQRIIHNLEAGAYAAIMKTAHLSAHVAYNAVLQLILTVTEDHINTQGFIAWERLHDVPWHEPVTTAQLAQWFAAQPPRPALVALRQIMDGRRTQPISWGDAIDACAAQAPALLPDIIPALVPREPRELALYARAGVALGEVMVARAQQGQAINTSALEHAAPEAILVVLRDAPEALYPYGLQTITRAVISKPRPEGFIQAYAHAAMHMITRTNHSKDDYHSLRLRPELLDAPHCAAVFRAAAKHDVDLCRWLMTTTLLQGKTHVFDAVAAMLNATQSDVAQHAQHLLALSAEVAHTTLKRARDAAEEGHAATRANAVLALTTPTRPSNRSWSPLAGYLYRRPRFGCTAEQLLVSIPAPPQTTIPPTPLPDIRAALFEQRELPQHGWADIVWMLTCTSWLNADNVAYVYARALKKGVLGRGGGEISMLAAVDQLDWSGAIVQGTTHHGFGNALIRAGATPKVFQHALGRIAASPLLPEIGLHARHFERPFKAHDASWCAPLLTLCTHTMLTQQNPYRTLAPPTLVGHASGAPATMLSLEASEDIWLEVHARDAARITVTLRNDAVWTIDMANQCWSLQGTDLELTGATPPLAGSVVTLHAELHKGRAILGVNDVVVEHQRIDHLIATDGLTTFHATVEGPNAALTTMSAWEKYSETLAEAILNAADAPFDPQTLHEAADLQTPEAAFGLYALAELSKDDTHTTHIRAALTTMGDHAVPFLGVQPIPAHPRTPRSVSFDQLAEQLQGMFPDLTLQRFDTVENDDDVSAVSFGDVNNTGFNEDDDDWDDADEEEEEDDYGPPANNPDDPTAPVPTALYLFKQDDDDAPHPDPNHFFLEHHDSLMEQFSCFPNMATWWDGHYEGMMVKGEDTPFLVMDLSLYGTDSWDGGDYGECLLAYWPVEEGWVLAVWSSDGARLRKLMGVSVWPARHRWQSVRGPMGV